MTKYPKPFFRPSRKLWYLQLDGKQINLGPVRDADRCRAILTTDLDWPPYRTLLLGERRMEHAMYAVLIRDTIIRDQAAPYETIERVAAEFLERNCDGLYLTAVSHDGVRLPVEQIVRNVELQRPIKMVVVDGAQDIVEHLVLDSQA